MKQMCKNCTHARLITDGEIKKALDTRAEVAKTKAELAGMPGRKDAINKIRAAADFKVKGLEDISMKSTDVAGAYMACSSEQHLADEKSDVEVMHRYYFTCEHFEADED